MAKLSAAMKKELLRMANSSELRHDFQMIENNQRVFRQKTTVDDYIDFLDMAMAFVNHRPKPFIKIEGGNFKL